ncbi:lipase secretion chaperone [Gilvimarinus sp. F26214L]|uniref:lipase secretion chaperone n=1 Tax=Gilvimarinus sp. DZF01 TaxID=3461371 RepID=UPI0040464438
MAKTPVMISGLAALAVVGGLTYWQLSANEGLVPIPTPNKDAQNPNAIANQWQWDNFTETKPDQAPTARSDAQADASGSPSEVPFDVVAIYNVLQSIELDEQGRVVPDQMAKEALEDGFAYLGPDISPQAMSELQELIRIGLPGEAGEEAARIMKNYYDFRLAEEEFNRQRPKNGDLPTAESYEELVQLRRRFLGDEIADGLFAVEDIQARHMLGAIGVQQSEDLTEEEKQSRQAALQEKLNDRLLALGQLEPEEAAAEEVRRLRETGASTADIYSAREAYLGPERAQELAAADREEAEWESRFERFWQARQQVMQASLDEAEQERQIELLLAQHFSPEERERARITSFEWQARDSE